MSHHASVHEAGAAVAEAWEKTLPGGGGVVREEGLGNVWAS